MEEWKHPNCSPENYALRFRFEWDPEEFEGKSTITLNIERPVSSLDLDAEMMDIKSVTALCYGKKLTPSYSLGKGILHINLGSKVSGRCKLEIRYVGRIREDMNGLFKQRYIEGNLGSYMLATQLESVFARSVFPCFDEPGMKATFDVTIVAPKSMKAVSNMPAKSARIERSMKITRFARTPKMSTYLLFIGVGNFGYRRFMAGEVPIGIFARKEKAYMISNSTRIAAKVLDFFSGYLGTRYALPKLDFIAVPGFNAAMENWGAIASGERDILYDQRYASIYQMQNISDTIAHEIAHQWFGNLVTTGSWEDLWLNESFADLMSHKALDSLLPKWNIRTQYAIELFNGGVAADSLKNTHPISASGTKLRPEDMFDAISYNKGYLVLRMLEDYIGSDRFLAGIRRYLKENAYGTASPDKLIGCLEQAADSKKSAGIREVALSWLKTPGMPIIESRLRGKTIHMYKSRFYASGTEPSARGGWIVPVSYFDSEGIEGHALIKGSHAEIKTEGRWVILNHLHSGFYRVKYDKRQLETIGAEISKRGIEALDAFGVENDLYAIARSGLYGFGEYVRFVMRYCKDTDPYTAKDIMVNFNDIVSVCGNRIPEKLGQIISAYAKKSLAEQRGNAAMAKSTPGVMLMSATLELLGNLGYKEVISWSSRMIGIALSGGRIEPDIRASAYFVASRSGKLNFRDAVKLYKTAKSAAERVEIVYAMGLIKDKLWLSSALDYLSSEGSFYDEQLALKAAFSSFETTGFALEWLSKNWDRISKKFAQDSSAMQTIISYVRYIASEKDLSSFRAFFAGKAKSNASSRYAISNAEFLGRANISFVKRIRSFGKRDDANRTAD